MMVRAHPRNFIKIRVITPEYCDVVNPDDLFLYAHNVSIIGNALNVRALTNRELS